MTKKLYNGKAWPDLDCINCGGYIHKQTQLTGFFDHAASMPIRVFYTALCADCGQNYMVFFVDGKVRAKYTIDDFFQIDRDIWPRRTMTTKRGHYL